MIKRESFYCSPQETRAEIINQTLERLNVHEDQVISIQEHLAIQDAGTPINLDVSMRIIIWYKEKKNEK